MDPQVPTTQATFQTQSDIITEAGDAVDDMLSFMSLTIQTITQRPRWRSLHPSMPTTLKVSGSSTVQDPHSRNVELALDLIHKAKELETMISNLPCPDPDDTEAQKAERLKLLEEEKQELDAEYEREMEDIDKLFENLKATKKSILDKKSAFDARVNST
ncbi:hypothetical protein BT69DRAFT_1347186 [Atractiella rhizophila]|nr:hypothetical protein BT69DRAFT_1347186 [Atractiella rhizophila]